MDFSTLQATVTGQYDAQAQTFSFDPAPYESQAITDLLANVVEQQAWQLTGAAAPQVDASGQTIAVSGVASSFYEHADAALTMVFFLSGGSAQVLIKLDLTADWSFTTAFPELQGTVFDEVGLESGTVPKYVFASADYTDSTLENGIFVPNLNFYGSVAPASTSPTFGPLMSVLGKFVHTTAVGPLAIYDGTPTMTLTLGFQQTLTQYVPLLANHVEIQLVCRLDDLTNEVGLLLGTKFDFGNNKGLEIYTLLTPMPLGIMTFTGRFSNIALPTPTQFAQEFQNLIGGNDLYEALPSEYQASTDLYLKTISVGIGTSSLKPVVVALEIGMPAGGTGWQLGDFANVSQVVVTANVQNPFDSATRLIALAVGGQLSLPTAGQPIALNVRASANFAADKPAEYEVQAGLAPGSALTIPVGDIVNKYLPAAINLPDITLNQLGVDFKFRKPNNSYALYAGLDPSKPLRFEFGGTTAFEVLYANFHIANDGTATTGGMVGGMKLFSVETDFEYQTPGDFKVTALIPSFDVDIKEIADGLLPTAWELPDWLPVIPFPQTSLYVQRKGSGVAATYTFAVLAQPSFGSIVLQVLKQSTGWAFAAGLQLNAPKIAAFDSLSMLKGMDVMFKVNELVFVFTSANLAGGFQFPLTTDFQGGTGKNIQVPNWAGPVKAGFYFYGSMQLNIEEQENLKLVPMMLGLDIDLKFNLFVFIGLQPTQNAFVQAGIEGKINDTTLLKGNIGARMEAGEPQFYLEGIVTTVIEDGSGKKQDLSSCSAANMSDCLTAGVAFELTPNAAFLSVSMIGTVTFGPITLSNLVVVVGINFEGIPSLGFAAQIDLQAYGTSYDSSLAFFFDSGDPAKSLFAGAISDVTLKQIADTVVGAVTGGDKPPVWLDDLLAQVGVSGTDTFYLPAGTATALNAKKFDEINVAFDQAGPGGPYSFSLNSSLLIVGETDLDEPGVWFITDYPASNVIMHYELHTEHDGRIRVALEPQFYYCMPPGGGSVTLGPPSAGLTFNPGVFLAGQLDVFMLHLVVKLEIIPSKGFAVDVKLTDPIVIVKDYLSLTGNQDPTKGPQFSMATYPTQVPTPEALVAQAALAAPKKRIRGKKALMAAAEATTTRPAHFFLDGKVDFLGLHVATTIDVTTAGLLLDFAASIGDDSLGAGLAVKTSLNSDTGFSFDINGNVHINDPEFELFNIKLGKLDLKVLIEVGLSFGINADGAFLHLKESVFEFGSIKFTIPGLDLDVNAQRLSDIPGIIYDAVKNLIWEFLKDAAHWLEWIGQELIKGFEDIAEVLEEIYNAIASVWGNEKRIVVAISESFSASQSTTIKLIPDKPGNGITQEMLDSARAWAEQTAEFAATQAIIKQVKETSPDDVGKFQVNSVQSLDFQYELQQNQNWFLEPNGPLPSLTALGFQNPFSDPRFYNQSTAVRKFQPSISINADFNNTVSRVTVTVRYNGVDMGKPYIFTSKVARAFSAAWVNDAGENFELKYDVLYTDSKTLSTDWMPQKGPVVQLLVGDSPAFRMAKRATRSLVAGSKPKAGRPATGKAASKPKASTGKPTKPRGKKES
ncbi:hypothetical protein [Hymenobacter negativus]|uniref:Uncharacterized protein n=1 Tax=Hymenobacter negativus TaxID=2795026 RepID=A0ABS3QLF4_9BACT|nr:hypothetical protein [Hymenobacter negativus]MBO2011916.1 hypothetical protein [Hymenobacter negativus]